MLLEILLLILGLAYSFWLYNAYEKLWKHVAKFPGPIAFPIVGNILQIGFKPEEYFSTVRRWFKEYNFETFRIYAGSYPYLIFPNKKVVEHVLSSTSLTYKSDTYNFFRPWMGQGLLISNGTYWVKHRKMITPSFHFQILQDFLHVINDTTERFMGLLETFSDKQEMFDFQDVITRSTIDVICECAMGTRVNAIEGKPAPIVGAMSDICIAIEERIFSALKRVDFFYRLTPEYRLQSRALKTLRRDFSAIIERRRQYLQQQQRITHKDEFTRPKMAFLDNLLTAEIDGQPLTFQEIFEEVSTFMFEGHDTTASALGFAAFCLSRHAAIQQKAFNEQFKLFGSDRSCNPSYRQLADMKYLELVIKEVLRLFPSVPLIARNVTEMTEVGGYMVPPGATIVIPIIGVSTDERNFAQPFEFRPERFEAEQRLEANPFDYVPFSAGPRNCIGQKFAMMEIKVTISKILRNFEILPAVDGLSSGIYDPAERNAKPHKYDPRLAALITLKSTNGIYIRLRKRDY